jgi:hypothetical protein
MRSGRFRLLFLTVVATCMCAGLMVSTSSPVAAAVTCGDSGSLWETVVVGVPRSGAGLVDVHDRDGGPQRLIRPASLGQAGAVGDRFGAAIVSGDFNDDRCVDLVVGAPGTGGVGAVYVVYGTTAGVGLGSVIRLPYAGFAGDAFGTALAVEVAGGVHIWVGAPGRDVDGNVNAGAVVRYTLTDGAVSSPSVLTQNSPGVPGAAEPGDRFGQVLAPVDGGVLIGQPREDVGAMVNAGMVTVMYRPDVNGGRSYGITENTPGIGGAAESGDRFGAALSGFNNVAVVGVPREDLGSIRNAGTVHAIELEEHPIRDIQYFNQNSAGVPGTPEAGDRFGASVQLYTEQLSNGRISLGYAVGAPGEDLGTVANAGSITTYVGNHVGPSRVYHRGPNARPGDALGAAIGLLSGDVRIVPDERVPRLVVGSPGEAIGSVPNAGVVEVVDPIGYALNIESSYTLSTGSHAGTRYGSVISKTAFCWLCD